MKSASSETDEALFFHTRKLLHRIYISPMRRRAKGITQAGDC